MSRGLARLAFWRRPEAPQPPPRLITRLIEGEVASDPLVELLFEAAPVGSLLVDANGRVLRANRALHEMVGAVTDLAAGADAARLFAGERTEAVWPDILNALRGRPISVRNAPARIAARVVEGTDATVAVRVTADLLRRHDGSVDGALLRIVDITLQTQLEAQLANSQKLQAVGQLAGGIAHDFNNLLTTVLGAAESIATRPGIDPETAEDAVHIQKGAARGAGLVRQLLAFSRQQTLQPRTLAVNEVISDLSDLLRRLLGERVRLALDLETPGRSVRADRTQVDQVLVNLAVNARDAMPDGGTLTLRTGHMTLYRPLVSGAETIPPGRYVMIEVSDSGTGIPDDVLPRIFDPFFTTKRDHGGHGLGLSTVHGIVRQSGGFLAVESEVGQGTRFRIYLPRWDELDAVDIPSVPVAAAAPVAAAVEAARHTILLVEDEEPVRRLAERSFRRRGWEVLAAESGEAALALLDAAYHPISAIVTDMVMPGMDGATLLKAVRARPGMDRVPAVLVSGYADEGLRKELESGSTSFLPKPYMPQELVARVAQALAAGEMRAAV